MDILFKKKRVKLVGSLPTPRTPFYYNGLITSNSGTNNFVNISGWRYRVPAAGSYTLIPTYSCRFSQIQLILLMGNELTL